MGEPFDVPPDGLDQDARPHAVELRQVRVEHDLLPTDEQNGALDPPGWDDRRALRHGRRLRGNRRLVGLEVPEWYIKLPRRWFGSFPIASPVLRIALQVRPRLDVRDKRLDQAPVDHLGICQ